MECIAVITTAVCLFCTCSASYVSYKKTVTSKSVHWSSPPVTAITDGDDAGLCFKSANSVQEWITIDLDKTYKVSSVVVINVAAEEGSDEHLRMVDAEVHVSSSSSILFENDVRRCGTPANTTQVSTSQIIEFECSPTIRGQYVSVLYSSKSETLNICEVRVYDEEEIGIGECSDPPLRINYYGVVGHTADGIICQHWNSMTPHTDLIIVPSSYLIHNLCRNPDFDSFGPWCYTMDPSVRFGYCNVPDMIEPCPQGRE
ncbi:uncharacterized protein [Antedon mediterranea]|uniref:uncharacterized protein n=1 Tax=Antedon mediterranea TaxID=105859 RepID=UPI003AF57509